MQSCLARLFELGLMSGRSRLTDYGYGATTMQRWKRGERTSGRVDLFGAKLFCVLLRRAAWILLQLLECRRVAREVPEKSIPFPSPLPPPACSMASQESGLALARLG